MSGPTRFIRNFRNICKLYENNETFQTDVYYFLSTSLSSIVSLDNIFKTSIYLLNVNEQRGYMTLKNTSTFSLVKLEQALLDYDLYFLQQTLNMPPDDIDKLYSYPEFSFGKHEHDIKTRYEEFQRYWPEYDLNLHSINDLSYIRLEKVWNNVLDNVEQYGFLCEIDPNETDATIGLYQATHSSKGVFFIGNTDTKYKATSLTCDFDTKVTFEVGDVRKLRTRIPISCYMLCSMMSVDNELKNNVQLETGINFDSYLNIYNCLNKDGNNYKLQIYINENLLIVSSLPTELCSIVDQPQANLMNVMAGDITSSSRVNLFKYSDDLFPLVITRPQANLAYMLADLAVTYDFDPFVGLKELEEKEEKSKIVIVITFFIIFIQCVIFIIFIVLTITVKQKKY